jgi:GH25 family lysozyme M1 (1,4-beta-N-acetylmuramidase)
MKPIIDISFWQPPLTIDYDKLADQVDGVIIRAAYGTGEDTKFDQHYLELSARGVPVGAYHYLIGSQSMSKQASAFNEITAGKELKLGRWMDVEDTRSGTRLYLNQVLEYAALMPDMGIYTSRSKWHEIMGGMYLTDRKLWVAHYTTASAPLMPVGFSSYWLWQYSSTGKLDGYNGNLDMNRFGGSEQEWLAWIGEEVPPEPEPPVEVEDKLFDAKVTTTPPNRLKTRYTPAGLVRPEADWLQSQAIVPVYETHSTGWWRVADEAWSSTQWLARVGEEPPTPPQPPMVGDYAYYGGVYNQRDIRWAAHPLGTRSTIGANGCLMTCVSMVCNHFGHASNPLQLNDWLTNNEGYLDGNLFLWASIERLYPDMKFDGFVYNPTRAQIAAAIRSGTLPILYVDFDDKTPLIEMHWVLGIGVTDDDVLIADPWTGTIGKLSEMYPKSVIRYGSYKRR